MQGLDTGGVSDLQTRNRRSKAAFEQGIAQSRVRCSGRFAGQY